jgi:hypothetical protein
MSVAMASGGRQEVATASPSASADRAHVVEARDRMGEAGQETRGLTFLHVRERRDRYQQQGDGQRVARPDSSTHHRTAANMTNARCSVQ